MRSGTRNEADIHIHNCLSSALDKNWINGIEARISLQSNKPVNYYCINLYWYCVIFIFTHCMSSDLRGLLPFCPLHYIITILLLNYIITILPITLYYYRFAHHTTLLPFCLLHYIIIILPITLCYYLFAYYTILLLFCPLHYSITVLHITLYY
jgi:hypothetical protein